MKLTGQNVVRNGEHVVVTATFQNKWRKPSSVKVVVDDSVPDTTVIQGDVKETIEVLHCLAEIAWNQGWRPAGLVGHIAAVVEKHQIPKA